MRGRFRRDVFGKHRCKIWCGQVVKFAGEACKKMGDAGTVVLLEGRPAQRTPPLGLCRGSFAKPLDLGSLASRRGQDRRYLTIHESPTCGNMSFQCARFATTLP